MQASLKHIPWLAKIFPIYGKEAHDQIIYSVLFYFQKIDCNEEDVFKKRPDLLGLNMAELLFYNHADATTIIAAIVYELYFEKHISLEILQQNFSESVISILKGIEKMSVIRTLQNAKANRIQVNNYKKMLLAIIEDVRIVLVKLSERICFLRNVKDLKKDMGEKAIAIEIIDIYAPLANRLGLYNFKKELEDKALKLLDPVEYHRIESELTLGGAKRVNLLNKLIAKIKQKLYKQSIDVTISGRVKHVYSIWKKIRKKGYGLNQLFDINAIRILVDTVPQCYKVLSIIHETFKPIQSEYADYISAPKKNGYQSIHTVILTGVNIATEVQIRTHKMHEVSENGVAAHWRYKEGVQRDQSYESRIIWLKSLLDWQKSLEKEVDYKVVQDLKKPVIDARVYVFTPNGDVIDLPNGSTVLDFAYNVHTMVGHRCCGAKVNGGIVSLTYKLETGQMVQILTGKEPKPSKDWVNKKQGYIFSPKIRNRVAKWFKTENKEKYVKVGREKILNELKGRKFKSIDFDQVSRHFNMIDEAALYAAIGAGDLRLHQVVNYLSIQYEIISEQNKVSKAFIEKLPGNLQNNSSIIIHGIDRLLCHMAGCCKPVLGEAIAGYITKSSGVSVHRNNCKNYLHMCSKSPDRVIEVQWGKENTTKFIIDLKVKCLNEEALSKVYGLLSANNIQIISMDNVASNNAVVALIKIAITDLNEIELILKKIHSLKNILSVFRVNG